MDPGSQNNPLHFNKWTLFLFQECKRWVKALLTITTKKDKTELGCYSEKRSGPLYTSKRRNQENRRTTVGRRGLRCIHPEIPCCLPTVSLVSSGCDCLEPADAAEVAETVACSSATLVFQIQRSDNSQVEIRSIHMRNPKMNLLSLFYLKMLISIIR